jgi:hypothetical protein
LLTSDISENNIAFPLNRGFVQLLCNKISEISTAFAHIVFEDLGEIDSLFSTRVGVQVSACFHFHFELLLRTLMFLKGVRESVRPLLAAVSYLEPASIQTPTVAVSLPCTVSGATRDPVKVVTSVWERGGRESERKP